MKTILIVEDDRTLRENIAVFLVEENFNVVVADDGLEGIQKAIKNHPDLILCDISMPNMNGYDFLKTIQQINYTSSIPFVFLTAKAEKEDIRIGMHLGVDDYLTKPFDFNELLKVINVRLAKYEKIQQVNDEKFNALIETPAIGVFIFQNSKIVFFNETFAKIFGFSVQEFRNLGYDENFEEIINSEYSDKVINNLEKCINDASSSIHLEFLAIHKSLKDVSIEMYGSVINYKGVSSVIGSITDLGKSGKSLKSTTSSNLNSDMFTKREIEVLELICQGYTTNKVSEKLFISNRTVDTHRANLLSKSGCKNIAELLIYANKNNLINLP
ncbi:MAG: response regulator [Bacteroidales bacterium]|nr:response regulator [Bacteroidales bacterium]